MKIQFYHKDAAIIQIFLSTWMPEKSDMTGLLMMEESDTLYFDCSPEELANCFDALTKKGFTQSAKHIFQGDHFYRSDTGKCPRCYRFRPEIHWNNEHLKDAVVCDRCMYAMSDL